MDSTKDFLTVLSGGPRGPIPRSNPPPGRPVELGQDGVFRPYVISWNITKRCNLACSHCYIDAVRRKIGENELSTEQCFRIADSIAESNPGCLVILTGGEPLMRED